MPDERPNTIHGNGAGIHPAPSEFTKVQVATDPILHFFHYSHLPERLRPTSRLFMILAHTLIESLPRNAERTVALRKLLEAKDAAVRANLIMPGATEGDLNEFEKHWKRGTHPNELGVGGAPLGEPVEIGGHNQDRDGDPEFSG